jgi:hypothetical protein
MSKFEQFLQVSESIIASCKNVQLMQNVALREADFESTFDFIEKMQSLVCENFKDSDEFITNELFLALLNELYENAKCTIEVLEEYDDYESVTDSEVIELFDTIRSDIDTIRKMCETENESAHMQKVHTLDITEQEFDYIRMLILSDEYEDSNENEYKFITTLRKKFCIS